MSVHMWTTKRCIREPGSIYCPALALRMSPVLTYVSVTQVCSQQSYIQVHLNWPCDTLAVKCSRYMRNLPLFGIHTFLLFFMSFFALRTSPLSFGPLPPHPPFDFILLFFYSAAESAAWPRLPKG